MSFLKKLDGAMQPVRWLSSLILMLWWGGIATLLFIIELPILGWPVLVMTLVAAVAVCFNARKKYWYHDND